LSRDPASPRYAAVDIVVRRPKKGSWIPVQGRDDEEEDF
jgi:hypothetical protein